MLALLMWGVLYKNYFCFYFLKVMLATLECVFYDQLEISVLYNGADRRQSKIRMLHQAHPNREVVRVSRDKIRKFKLYVSGAPSI